MTTDWFKKLAKRKSSNIYNYFPEIPLGNGLTGPSRSKIKKNWFTKMIRSKFKQFTKKEIEDSWNI